MKNTQSGVSPQCKQPLALAALLLVCTAGQLALTKEAGATPVPSQYRIIPLEGPEGKPTTAVAINSHGTIVGREDSVNKATGLSWDFRSTGRVRARIERGGPLGPDVVQLRDINDHREIVGSVEEIILGPFGLPTGGTMVHPLHRNQQFDCVSNCVPPPTGSQAELVAINNDGVVASQVVPTYAGPPPAIYRLHYSNGPMSMSGLLLDPFYERSYAYDINDRGDIVGSRAQSPSHALEAIIYPGDWGVGLGGVLLSCPQPAVGLGVDDRRRVVGSCDGRAAIWEPTPSGGYAQNFIGSSGTSGEAQAINNLGWVVGSESGQGAFLWHPDLGAPVSLASQVEYFLNQPQWTSLSQANDINDAGEIVGHGTLNGQRTAYVLVPIREYSLDTADDAIELGDAGSMAVTTDLILPTAEASILDSDLAMTTLAPSTSEANDVNAAQSVVGSVGGLGAQMATSWNLIGSTWSTRSLPSNPDVDTDPTVATANSDGFHIVGYSKSVWSLGFGAGADALATTSLVPIRSPYVDYSDRALKWEVELDGNIQVEAVTLCGGEPRRGDKLVDVNASGHAIGWCARTSQSARNEQINFHSDRFGAERLSSYSVDVNVSMDSRGHSVGWFSNGTTDLFVDPSPDDPGLGDPCISPKARRWHLDFSQPVSDRWQAAGLGSLGRGPDCPNTTAAYGTNNRDDIVGIDVRDGGETRAFLWHDGVMMNLNHFVEGEGCDADLQSRDPATCHTLVQGISINDVNEVLARGMAPGQTQEEVFRLRISERGRQAAELCQGWCYGVGQCDASSLGNNDFFERPAFDWSPTNGCVDACLEYAMTHDEFDHQEELAVQACFYERMGLPFDASPGDTQAFCSATNWANEVQDCCRINLNLSIQDCSARYGF